MTIYGRFTVLTNAFIHFTYFCFSRCHVTTNSVAPSPLYKPQRTHNSPIRSNEGLKLETSAFRIPVRWSIYIINSVVKTAKLLHQRNTTVSLETTAFDHLYADLICYQFHTPSDIKNNVLVS